MRPKNLLCVFQREGRGQHLRSHRYGLLLPHGSIERRILRLDRRAPSRRALLFGEPAIR